MRKYLALLAVFMLGCHKQAPREPQQFVMEIDYSFDGSNWNKFSITNWPENDSTDVVMQLHYIQVTNDFILIGAEK